MEQSTINIIKLSASVGMMLTNGEVYSKEVYLGCKDSLENWWEIPESQAQEMQTDELS